MSVCLYFCHWLFHNMLFFFEVPVPYLKPPDMAPTHRFTFGSTSKHYMLVTYSTCISDLAILQKVDFCNLEFFLSLFSCSLQGFWTFLCCLSITFRLYIYLRCVLFSFPAVHGNIGTRRNLYIELVACTPVKCCTSSFWLVFRGSLHWLCFCLQLEMALTVLWISLPQLLPSCVLSVCLHHLQRLELFLHRCL